MFLIRNASILLRFFVIAVYILLPFDLVPEVVFGLVGFLDDIVIIIWVLFMIVGIYRTIVSARRQ
jgi:RING finger protein 170